MMAAIPARAQVNGSKPAVNGTPVVPAPAKEPEKPAPLNTAEHPMVGLVEHLFREWNQLERAVAAQRLFAAEPISLRPSPTSWASTASCCRRPSAPPRSGC